MDEETGAFSRVQSNVPCRSFEYAMRKCNANVPNGMQCTWEFRNKMPGRLVQCRGFRRDRAGRRGCDIFQRIVDIILVQIQTYSEIAPSLFLRFRMAVKFRLQRVKFFLEKNHILFNFFV